MEIVRENHLSTIAKIVEEKAKFQKVLLIYDDTASSIQESEIYEEVRENCVFNKVKISSAQNEIYDGYRVLIFLCSADEFLHFNFERGEFCSIFVPTDKNLLPFFLDEHFNLFKQDNFLLIDQSTLDLSIQFSVLFNKVFKFLNCIAGQQNYEFAFSPPTMINQNAMLNLLDEEGSFFFDVCLMRECNIEFRFLPCVDVVLFCAFDVLIRSYFGNSLTYVDFYKSMKDDEPLIDKFFALSSDNVFLELIKMNKNLVLSTFSYAEKLFKQFSANITISDENLREIISKIKTYAKFCNNIVANLYLFNLFGT